VKPGWRRRVKLIAIVGAVHMLATVAALVVSFSAGFDTFEAGVPESSVDRLSARALQILSFPLLSWLDEVPRMQSLFPGLLGYIPSAANSALWAVALYGLVSVARHLRKTSRTACAV
jgi:hypothetical protein